MMKQPNILFIMTDQQRFDTIAALGTTGTALGSTDTALGTTGTALGTTDIALGKSDIALGNPPIYTPNLDRLVQRGIAFTNAYSPCPVCVPARYIIRTGCEPPTTRHFTNGPARPITGQAATMEGRCGDYLARTLSHLGYRTFGIGKFHTYPWNEDLGFAYQTHSEELYGSLQQRAQDGFAGWIARQHPQFDYLEMLMGERTEMYYMPQVSPLPAELTVEHWAADQAVEQLKLKEDRPYFGFVSFVGPHPPFAPPLPFNRMYDPDRMPNPVPGDLLVDHMDEQIPWMNYLIWAEDINDSHARTLKARYYGEISYIDACLGRILDQVEARGDADNTLICFFSDHGDHLGDHHAWQKESFFEASCHIPFLLSWPEQIPASTQRNELVALTDLFGIATAAAGKTEIRQGVDVLGMLSGQCAPRHRLVGMYGDPGTPLFKVMVRQGPWKYIFLANGGGELLFNLATDPQEAINLVETEPGVANELRREAAQACATPGAVEALSDGDLLSFPFQPRRLERVYQFDASRGVHGFPDRPQDVLTGRS